MTKHIVILLTLLLPVGHVLASSKTIVVVPPNPKAQNMLEEFNRRCKGCLNNGVILIGDDNSFIKKRGYFKNFFQGIEKRGYFLLKGVTWTDFYKKLKSMKTREEFLKRIRSIVEKIELVVVDNDFKAIRRIKLSLIHI